MLLEFSTFLGNESGVDVSGDLNCEADEAVVICTVDDPKGIDHVVVTSGGEMITTVNGPSFEFEIERDRLEDTPTGREFTVDYRNADGETVQRHIERVADWTDISPLVSRSLRLRRRTARAIR